MWRKPLFGLPIMVTIYLTLAIACSAVWLYSFNLQIYKHEPPSNHERKSLLFLLIAYVTHLPVLVILPFCSRPWLWSKEASGWVRVLWRVLGWDEGGDHWCYCLLEGLRAVASLLVAWTPFAFASSMAGILGLAAEGFLAAEMVKHTEAEDAFFMCQMASATYAAERLFGLGGAHWWTVFSVCLCFIALHSVLPFYEDVFTLLPEPYRPEEASTFIPTRACVLSHAPPSAQHMSITDLLS